jgi:hypothetical protein
MGEREIDNKERESLKEEVNSTKNTWRKVMEETRKHKAQGKQQRHTWERNSCTKAASKHRNF